MISKVHPGLIALTFIGLGTLSSAQELGNRAVEVALGECSPVRTDTILEGSGSAAKIRRACSDSTLQIIQLRTNGAIESISRWNTDEALNGTQVRLDESGRAEWISVYHDGFGLSAEFYPNGNVRESYCSEDGRYTEFRVVFCDAGEIYVFIRIIRDREQVTGYYCSGGLRETGTRVNGEKVGTWKYFDTDGTILREENY